LGSGLRETGELLRGLRAGGAEDLRVGGARGSGDGNSAGAIAQSSRR
jgi:hypothetical protein